MRSRGWPFLAHIPVVLCLFWGVLFEGRVPFFRDLLSHYYPDYVFLSRAVSQGVYWPLWNPMVHAGSPFLVPYPVEWLCVVLLGPLTALRIDPALHVLIAMTGASALARSRAAGPVSVWATGLFYGLSGFLLSASNTMQIFHAACWAPWVGVAVVRVLRSPSPRSGALLGLAVALQVSTLAADIVVQTAFACLFLLPRRPSLRAVATYAAAAALAVLLAAPVLLGTHWLLQGTRRAAGFDPQQAFDLSAGPMVLLESVVPHFFGDVRTFSEIGYWGLPFFGRYPYFMSLYLGPGILLLAFLAGLRHALWGLVVVGLLLALGSSGPLASLLFPFVQFFRFPVKFFFLANLALCLLAGAGIERCVCEAGKISWLRFIPAALLLAAAGALW